jgi:hypothetical protein
MAAFALIYLFSEKSAAAGKPDDRPTMKRSQ